MQSPIYQEALEAYINPLHEFTVKPIKTGLINQSFKVTSKTTGDSFLLQKINLHVFPEPENVQHNYELLWKYLRSEEINFSIPEPKYFLGDTTLFCDSKDNYWRVFEFVEGAKTYDIAEKTSRAKAVAQAFAKFTTSFIGFGVEQLAITIPNFHNLSFRFNQFRESLHTHKYERLQKAANLIAHLKERERYANFYDVVTESEEFPKRVMHHDAKISNILFDEESDEVICPVDLDTVMPGHFFSDIGDMIRSMVSNYDETNVEFHDIQIRGDFYKAILDGYMGTMNKHLTGSEKKYIHYAGVIMIYMQTLRFLTDYLNGDIYYRINYPEQNFDRSTNQLTLLTRLEEFLIKEYNFKI